MIRILWNNFFLYLQYVQKNMKNKESLTNVVYLREYGKNLIN